MIVFVSLKYICLQFSGSDTSSTSSSSSSSSSSSEDSDSDDDIDDTDLLIQIRKKLAASASSTSEKKPPEPDKSMETKIKEELEKMEEANNDELNIESSLSPVVVERTVEKRSTSIDERLKEQFNLLKDEEAVAPKKRRAGLVEEIIISVSLKIHRLHNCNLENISAKNRRR